MAAPVVGQAALYSKQSGALLALVRLLARQAAAEAVRSAYTSIQQEGVIP